MLRNAIIATFTKLLFMNYTFVELLKINAAEPSKEEGNLLAGMHCTIEHSGIYLVNLKAELAKVVIFSFCINVYSSQVIHIFNLINLILYLSNLLFHALDILRIYWPRFRILKK
jgi:hypothetical protein